MRRLTSIRLVHWYHFVDATFDLDGSCLIFGDNGSGKSTILDAIQWALVADQAIVRFNKAANENSRRTLYGYVRYKLGSEDEERPGQLKYGRKNATAHVILTFTDDEDPAHSFSCGVVMEATENDTRVERFHWVARTSDAAWMPVLDGAYVRPLRELRKELRGRSSVKLFGDARTYRDEVRKRLGPLKDSFHRLLIKSLDFKPIGKVKDFVFHYLLDDKPVDTDALQSNIEHYKRWEAEAVAAQKRIAALRGIVEYGRRVEQERFAQRSHLYVSLAARREVYGTRRKALGDQVTTAAKRRVEVGAEVEQHEQELTFLREQRDDVIGSLRASDTAQAVEEVERQLTRVRKSLETAKSADGEARKILARQAELLSRLLAGEARDLRARTELFEDGSLVGVAETPEIVERLFDTLSASGLLVGRDLKTWEGRLQKVLADLTLAKARLQEQLFADKDEGKALQKERQALGAGRHRYPDHAEALQHLLKQRLDSAREPRPLAELIEIKNERWRDAVEGSLGNKRFDVIVAPEDFERALGFYERHKRDYHLPGRGKVFIGMVGIVDVEKILAADRPAKPNSLATQIETDDPYARAYVDFLLGDIICVERERDLRKHKRSITDTAMTYGGFAARQIPRRAYQRHFCGRAAVSRRTEEIDDRLGELHESLTQQAGDQTWISESLLNAQNALAEVRRLPDLVATAKRIGNRESEIEVLTRRLDGFDQGEISSMKSERQRLDASIRVADEQQKTKLGEAARLDANIRHLQERLQEAQRQEAKVDAEIGELFPDAEERWTLEGTFAKLKETEEPSALEERYRRQHASQRTKVENLVNRLVAKKTEYANTYAFAVETEGGGFAEFEAELKSWEESRLPDYRERIAGTKTQAIQQLAEDIIFRLREHLQSVRRQIDELNRALSEVPFGSERYSFSLEVAKEHQDFFDLVMEAGRMERDSLFGGTRLQDEEAQRTLEGLFERLTSGRAQEVKSELSARADYREYFRYDLKIHHADGSISMYDRVAADKSGGETQTPYYVAILASMYRVYKSNALSGRPMAGLVLLDEAFGKMDESRIRATLELARALELQLVMATPKERSELVAPHVETSLYIHKDPLTGAPTVLDFTKEFEQESPAAILQAT